MTSLTGSLRKALGTRTAATLSLLAGVSIVASGLAPGVLNSAAATNDIGNAGVFELDGNIAQDAPTPPPYDWSCVFNNPSGHVGCPPGSVMQDKVFQADFGNPDPTYFSGVGAGIKDINDINTWGCVSLNNPLNKDDILNAYGAAFVPTSGPKSGHLLVYLAQERDSPNGDSFAGFWLMKNQHSCDSAGAGTFNGVHDVGDLLVVSNYEGGGTKQSVQLYEWNPADPHASNNLVLLNTGGLCGDTTVDTTDMCAIANMSTITEPWTPNQDLQANQFVEVGVDLTDLIPPDLTNENSVCFGDFLSETRSSQELTATLKDYTTGRFHLCVNPTVTTQQTAGQTTSASMVVEAGTAVSDQATLSGTIVGTPKGTIQYKLFSGTTCTGTVVYDSGKLDLVNGVPPSSGTTTQPVGNYEWQAFYSGDVALGGRNRSGASTCGDEPLKVVDASVGITPNGVNRVGTAHVFTITATADVPSGTSVEFNSITPSVSPTPGTHTTTCGSPTVNAAGTVATCTLTINSSTVGTFTANAAAVFTLGGLTVHRSTNDSAGPAGPVGTGAAVKHYVNASIAIGPPHAVNVVGAQHVFTVTVTAYPGDENSVLFGPITTSVLDSGNKAPDQSSTTCGSPTISADGNTATCTVTINNFEADTFTATASDTVTIGGLAIPVTTDGQGLNSGPAVKTYGNGNIVITPDGVNEVGHQHVFTVVVTGVSGTATTFNSISTSVLDADNSAPGTMTSTCGSPTIDTSNRATSGDTATCTVTINNSVADVFTANATAHITVNGFEVILTTNGQNGNSGPATKTYVDASVAITPPNAVNQVGQQHVFTIAATGLPANFSAAGTTITPSINPTPGTMSSTCGSPVISGNTATCTVTINSTATGTFTLNATADVHVDGLVLLRSTDSQVAGHGPGGSGPATKTYVDARITIGPSAVNEVGHQHVFTVTVTGLPANEPFSVDSITTDVSPAPSNQSTTCGDPTVSDNTATCTLTINSNSAGVFTANAAAVVVVDGVTLHRSTDGSAGGHGPDGSGPATKTYVDGSISIAPSAVNEVNHQHVFTVTVTALPTGQTYSFGSITTSVLDASDNAPGTMSSTCGSPVVNANAATCTVTIDNATADTFTANASAMITIDGLTISRSTGDGLGTDSGPATKTYVDASVGIGPSAHNPIGKEHVFNIVVTAYPSGASPVSFDSITPSVVPTPGSMSTTCDTPTVNGDQATCTLTINNDLPDTFVANVTAQVTMGGVQVTRSTASNPGPGGTGPATKNYVTANIGLSPLNADDPVGDLHTLTATVTTNDGSGEGQPAVAPDGTVVNFSIVSGPGSLSSPSCTISNGLGTCTDVLTSSVEGTTVVNATVTLTVDTVELTRSTDDSVPGDSPNAVKHWHKVQPSITTVQSTGGTIGTTVSDTAKVSGGLNPSGTVTFALYGPTDSTCSGTPVFISADQPLTDGSAQSATYTPTATGTFQWVATYNGDDSNLTAVSGCGDEPVTIVAAAVLGISTPNTGANLMTALAEGLGLVLAGTGIVFWARRRRQQGN